MDPDNLIYIVTQSYDWEGSYIEGAFFIVEDAIDYARKLANLRGGSALAAGLVIEKWSGDNWTGSVPY